MFIEVVVIMIQLQVVLPPYGAIDYLNSDHLEMVFVLWLLRVESDNVVEKWNAKPSEHFSINNRFFLHYHV